MQLKKHHNSSVHIGRYCVKSKIKPDCNIKVPVNKNSSYSQNNKWAEWLNTVKNFYSSGHISPIFTSQNCDSRPYIDIAINNITIPALLDTGATQCVLGKSVFRQILDNHFKINYQVKNIHVSTADGQPQVVIGTVDLPISLNKVTKVLKFLIIPSIRHNIILGIDFCKSFHMILNLGKNSWDTEDCTNPIESVAKIVPTKNSPGIAPNNLDYDVQTILNKNCNTCSLQTESDLNNDQMILLTSIIEKFKQLAISDLGLTHLVEHKIELTTNEPFRQKTFPLSPYMQEHMNKEIDRLLKLGVIRPSKSPYSSNVIMVKKTSGEYRLCFDGRKLNSITKPDSYPLPDLTSILDKLRDAHFLSTIDLRQAFFQIKLTKDSCEKTAFRVLGRGLFEFVRMPFGLISSAQSLQRAMDKLFDPTDIESHIFVYLDDLIIVNNSFESHMDTLLKVHDILKSAGLSINLSKCNFCKSSLAFLGYVVDKFGLHTNPDKVASICEYPRPRNTTEIKRFIGMASWYRRFIKDFSELVVPLNNLIKGKNKGNKVIWSEEAINSFENLKKRLASAPVLANPDFSKMFTIQTDSSDHALGGILTQGEGNNEHVIAYASRTLTKSERNYTTTERELLAIKFAISKFLRYVQATKFRVITDHSSLLWLHRLKNPVGRLARWAAELSQHDIEYVHRPGKLNTVPDALSRAPIYVDTIEVEEHDKWYTKMLKKVTELPQNFPLWHVNDNSLYKMVNLKHNIHTNSKQWKLVVPKAKRNEIMKTFHEDPLFSHFGVNKTFHRIAEQYFWPGLKSDLKKYIYNCQTCNEQKASQLGRAGLMGAPKNISHPFQLLSMDLMGPFPKSKNGNAYILVIVDWFTKFTFIYKLKRALTKTICTLLEENVLLVFGIPQIVVVDNGSQFISKEFKNLMNNYKVQHIWYNAKYHPQTNNVERSNRVIGTAIRSYVRSNHRDWDICIPKIMSAINNSIHEITQFSPSFLNFGRHVPITGEFYGKILTKNLSPYNFEDRNIIVNELCKLPQLYQQVSQRIKTSYERNKKYYNLRKRNIEFDVGDIVYKQNYVLSDAGKYFSAKLAPKFIKCSISKKLSPVIYELLDENNKNIGRYHIKDLKPLPGSISADNPFQGLVNNVQ